MPLEESIRKHALKNALDYGKADAKSVVGKVLAEFPESKKDMKGTMQKIALEIAAVNSLTKIEVAKEVQKYEKEFAEIAQKKAESSGVQKIELPNAEQGKVVTRFPPEPSGYPHIGHAKAAWLDFEAARAYDGKMILRFDDTNPEKESQEFVVAITDGLGWLGIAHEPPTFTSDYMEAFYTYAYSMLENADAYVCTCPAEAVKKGRFEQKECACRSIGAAETIARWKGMHEGNMAEGSAIVRFKGSMTSPNTVMRDPTLFRIITASHYRQGKKYRVWPSYDFVAPIIDSLEGVTHAMRTKEYELRDELYFAILEKCGLRKPELVEFSRLSIKNAPISKRLITPLIEQKKVSGWDDIRLPTLKGLARRGILPEAIKTFVLSFGLSKVESEPGWDKLLDENKKLLEPVSPRRYFVQDPAFLMVRGAPGTIARIKNHPSNPGLGIREIGTDGKFMISKADAELLCVDDTFRLKELYNAKVIEKTPNGIVADFLGHDLIECKKIQWVAKEDSIPCEILVPHDLLLKDGGFNPSSLETQNGLCESSCKELSVGTILQFERYGFVRLDSISSAKLSVVFVAR
jgi:glutamyl-tRNA synthetase